MPAASSNAVFSKTTSSFVSPLSSYRTPSLYSSIPVKQSRSSDCLPCALVNASLSTLEQLEFDKTFASSASQFENVESESLQVTEPVIPPIRPDFVVDPWVEFRDVVLDIFGWNPSWWYFSAPAGNYRATWIGGVVGFSGTSFWGLNHFSPSGGRRHGVQLLTTYTDIETPTAMTGRINWYETPRFFTEAEALSAVALQPTMDFYHSGGPLGISVYDNPYTDNRAGSSPVIFRIQRLP